MLRSNFDKCIVYLSRLFGELYSFSQLAHLVLEFLEVFQQFLHVDVAVEPLIQFRGQLLVLRIRRRQRL